ncbi:MAG: hypothetical protein AB1757_07330 [Acidobacteriota bacterium]
MNQQNKGEAHNQQTLVEDLTVTQADAEVVKGGPIYLRVEGVDGSVTSSGHEKWIE